MTGIVIILIGASIFVIILCVFLYYYFFCLLPRQLSKPLLDKGDNISFDDIYK